MSGQDFIVSPRSWESIQQIADKIRGSLGLAGTPYFPIMDVVEKVFCNVMEEFELEVWPSKEMNAAEGYTCPNGSFIALREDVYRDAWSGDSRARFTVAHEFGHFILHSGRLMARAPITRNTKAYCLSEPQANQFAAALLMPLSLLNNTDSPLLVTKKFGVSMAAAEARLKYYSKVKANK